MGVLNPKGKAGQSIQPVRTLIVFDEATAVPPSTTFVFRHLRRSPFPRPVELYGRTTPGRVIPHQLHVGVFMKVWIGMKFSRDEIVQVLGVGCEYIRKSVDDRVRGVVLC